MPVTIKKYYFSLFNLLILGMIIYFSVNAFFKIKTSDVKQPIEVTPSTSKTETPNKEVFKPLSQYQKIIDRNLFKTKATADKPSEKPNQDDLGEIEPTDLNLKLWGTSTGLGDKDYAVIEDPKNRSQNLYRTGDSIQNAIVKLIFREKVVLSVDGKDQMLEVEKPESGKSKKSYRQTKRQKRGPSRSRRTQKITLRRSRIDNAIEDVNKLMTQVNVRPHFNQGQPDGLMLTRIKPRSLFREMGLRNGDVITGINGENVESVDAALKLYDLLKSNTSVSLQLKRRGRNRTIEYTVR